MAHRVGRKGEVVIPKELRDRLGLHPGTEVAFVADDGGIRVIPLRAGAGLRGRYRGSGMTARLERDRRAEDG